MSSPSDPSGFETLLSAINACPDATLLPLKLYSYSLRFVLAFAQINTVSEMTPSCGIHAAVVGG